ncbi:helix-turn-helix domain-containing protein [Oleidesulfovibrio alaskensis]|jgi:quercetin dioxygenase-like cupin family protein/DNA-binding XRE family transcriptional regulator|uniref:helix-turn-helix domain-containing protein n=1 Tax=Oleidesulfovibrio alaskensis TaxID=58180 RepID=UPI00040F2D3C|nr:XRE family transcriptional regulator [Oleidesulfovibrio alaskensis]MBL3581297.1 cupin domain-containing protein [Oleidesulfovibrio alaskensis]
MSSDAFSQPYREIAPRLLGLRDAVGFSAEELAQKVGVTSQVVERYESGEVEIPVSYLTDVARACGVDLTALVSGGDAHLHDFTLVRKGEGLAVERRKDYDYRNLASRMTGRRMEPFMVRVPPKAESDLSWNEHSGQEFIYMLEGRLEIWLESKRNVLEPGDSIYFESRIPHALRALDGADAVFLDVIS